MGAVRVLKVKENLQCGNGNGGRFDNAVKSQRNVDQNCDSCRKTESPQAGGVLNFVGHRGPVHCLLFWRAPGLLL